MIVPNPSIPWLPTTIAFAAGAAAALILVLALLPQQHHSARAVVRNVVKTVFSGLSVAAIGCGLWRAAERVSSGSEANRLSESAFLLLAGIMASVLIALAGSLASNERVSLDSRWGSLGGARAGFDLSRPAVLLVIVLSCVFGLMAIGYQRGDDKKKEPAIRKLKLGMDVESQSNKSEEQE